jgi:hypothetical protein
MSKMFFVFKVTNITLQILLLICGVIQIIRNEIQLAILAFCIVIVLKLTDKEDI